MPGGAFTRTVRIFAPLHPAPSVAVIVTLKLPLCVGVPVTSPVPELMPTPGGRPVCDQVMVPGLPVCVNVAVAIAWLRNRSGIVPFTVMVGHVTVIEIVAAAEVSGAAHVAVGAPQLSGSPRSVTVNWNESGPT